MSRATGMFASRRLGLKALSTLPLAAMGGATWARSAEAPLGKMQMSGYRLVKNWDFVNDIRTQEALRQAFFTRYIYNNGQQDKLNQEWSRYRDHDNHVFTEQGLALVARVVGELQPGAVESGMLRSRWSGQYGVFEIRMKVPAGLGLWPAFWLNPQDGRWPPEIDVVEIVDNGRDTTRRSFHHLHGPGTKTAARRVFKLNRNNAITQEADYADGFHVFSVEWMPDAVRHYIDGELVADRDFQWRHKDGSDAGPAHVLVNLAVGGHWPGPPDAKALPARLEISHVRVWQGEGDRPPA